jgi:hypothetical protein
VKANSVGQIDYARASSKQGTASVTGDFVNVPFAIDSVGIAVNPTDAVAKIPLIGLGANSDIATPTIKAIFRCAVRYVYLNNVTVGSVTATNASATLTKATPHGMVVGDTFTVSANAAGFTAATKYYVKTVPTTSTFTASGSKGGEAITASSAGTLTVTKTSGTYNSVGATAEAPADTTAYEITPLIPGFGSGTASYFVGKIGHTEAAGFPSTANDQGCIKRKFLDDTTNIQEHAGASVAERENSIGIYSIGQWAAQTNFVTTGATNKTAGTVLLNLNPVGAAVIPATTGSGVTLAPNENWTSDLKRVVYNIVSYRKAIDPDSAINEMFVGTDSLVCLATASISKMGFTPLSSTDPTNVNSCGSIAAGNRTTYGSDGTSVTGASISALSSTVGNVGRPVTATVKVGDSNHQQGGTVIVTDNAVYGAAGANILGSVDVAADVAGDTGTTIEITPIAGGSTALYAYFVPRMGGVKVTALVAAGSSDVWTENIVVAQTSATFISVKKPAKIGGSARVVAIIDSAVFPGGTVTLKNAVTDATIATDTLVAGEGAAVFNFVQSTATLSVKAVYAPVSPAEGSTSPTRTWTLAKIVPTGVLTLAAAPNGIVASRTAGVLGVVKFAAAKAATVSATTDLVTSAAHGLVAGDAVTFEGSTTAPAGADTTTTYYVIASGRTASAFKVSATLAGTAVNFTTAGTAVKFTRVTAPKITLTLSSTDSTVTTKPTGSAATIHVYFGTTTTPSLLNPVTGTVTVVNGVATVTLDRSALKALVGTVSTTAVTKYLTFRYDGDGVFSNAWKLVKPVQFTS